MYDTQPQYVTLEKDPLPPQLLKVFDEASDEQQNKNYRNAIILYEQILESHPISRLTYFELARCYSMINKLETSVQLMTRAIIIKPSDVYYNTRGVYNYKIGNNDLAIDDFNFAIKINPQNYTFYENKALALNSKGLKEESCIELNKGFQLDSTTKRVPFIEEIYAKCK